MLPQCWWICSKKKSAEEKDVTLSVYFILGKTLGFCCPNPSSLIGTTTHAQDWLATFPLRVCLGF